MKNQAIAKMIAKQYNREESDIIVEFIASNKTEYEFKVTIPDKTSWEVFGERTNEELKITVKQEPWVEDF